jgi:hypothetical protein
MRRHGLLLQQLLLLAGGCYELTTTNPPAAAQANCWPMILIGGASDTEQDGMVAFQEGPQVGEQCVLACGGVADGHWLCGRWSLRGRTASTRPRLIGE